MGFEENGFLKTSSFVHFAFDYIIQSKKEINVSAEDQLQAEVIILHMVFHLLIEMQDTADYDRCLVLIVRYKHFKFFIDQV